MEVIEGCEYYSCECNRDVDLARSFGFKGEVLSVSPKKFFQFHQILEVLI